MPKNKVAVGAWGLMLVAWLANAPAATPYDHGSVQNGAAKAAVCFGCHGPNGNSSNPLWPTLAGQSAVYVAEQLRLFRSKVRDNPVMTALAAPLADGDIDDLAVYFAAQTPLGSEADPSYWQAGQIIYMRGDKTRAIPACTACHGALRAQQSGYTVKQLNDYAKGTRYGGATAANPASPNGYIMATIAKRLAPEDMRNLASYVQGLR